MHIVCVCVCACAHTLEQSISGEEAKLQDSLDVVAIRTVAVLFHQLPLQVP